MDVQYHYQMLLHHGVSQITGVAQSHYRNADHQVTQIEELQALVTQKDEIQNDLTAEEYATLMSDNVARAYNKKVKPKEFQIGNLVWEAVLPLGTKDAAYGKWSPNWHGPYRVDQVLPGNAYMLEELDGVKFPVAVNGQHLKRYFPSMWADEQ
jgi:hypothetical protein